MGKFAFTPRHTVVARLKAKPGGPSLPEIHEKHTAGNEEDARFGAKKKMMEHYKNFGAENDREASEAMNEDEMAGHLTYYHMKQT